MKILSVKTREAFLVRRRLYSLITEMAIFPEEALSYYKSIYTIRTIMKLAQDLQQVLLVAWKDKKIVGLLLGTKPEGGVATIIWLLVDKEYQNQGIGKQMFEIACQKYRSIGSHKIKLMAPNKEAVQFYKKQGMRVEGFHPKHWWNIAFWSMGREA